MRQKNNNNLMKLSGRVVLLVIGLLLFSLFLPLEVRSTSANTDEMERVCINWLQQIIAEKGNWAGSTNPTIIVAEVFKSDDDVVARCYKISPKGFIIVPILKEMPPVKMYSDESNIDSTWLENTAPFLVDLISNKVRIFKETYGHVEAGQPTRGKILFNPAYRQNWEHLTETPDEYAHYLMTNKMAILGEAGPLLTSRWHQHYPYNILSPIYGGIRCPTGCTITATAQIVNYWKWPMKGIGDNSYVWEVSPGTEISLSADFSDGYEWQYMADGCAYGCSDNQVNALAELNYEIGIAYAADYSPSATSASPKISIPILPRHFKFKNSIMELRRNDHTLENWFLYIKNEINARRPILYSTTSHAIVCDGYRDRGAQKEYHMNYGWGDSHNAWYVFDELYLTGQIKEHERMYTQIMPQFDPIIHICKTFINDSVGGNDNHRLDPGETANIIFTLKNSGCDIYDIFIKCISLDSAITVLDSMAYFGDSLAADEIRTAEQGVRIQIDSLPSDTILAGLLVITTSSSGSFDLDTCLLNIGGFMGILDSLKNDPINWYHQPMTMGHKDEWHVDSTRFHTPPISWKMGGRRNDNYADFVDAGLLTPPFVLPVNARLRFWQWLDAEAHDSIPGAAWDGAMVMIQTSDGSWEQITPIDGYSHAIIEYSTNPNSPFDSGMGCYSGNLDWTQIEFDLSEYTGEVRLMFRFGSDGWISAEGWYIDDIEVKSFSSRGNINGDHVINMMDAVLLIDYLFGANNRNFYDTESADTNCDNNIDLMDALEIINYLFIPGHTISDCRSQSGTADKTVLPVNEKSGR